MGYVEELRAVVGNRPLILVGVKVLIYDEAGRMLLHKKPSGYWAIPGGLMELGESTEETGCREVLEETGLQVGRLELVGVISGRDQFLKLRNGDEFYGVTVVYSTREIVGGTVRADGEESVEFRYFEPERMPVGMRDKILELLSGGS